MSECSCCEATMLVQQSVFVCYAFNPSNMGAIIDETKLPRDLVQRIRFIQMQQRL